MKKTGLDIKDIDIFEINEAFASQALYSIRTLGIDQRKVNPQGGAIAIGHPLGVTGARQIATGLARAKKTGEKLLVTSMCIGSGMVRSFPNLFSHFVVQLIDFNFILLQGMASIIVNEQ